MTYLPQRFKLNPLKAFIPRVPVRFSKLPPHPLSLHLVICLGNKNLVEGYPMLSYPILPYLTIVSLSIMKFGESSLTVVTNAFYKHGYSISCTVKEIRGKFGIQLLSYPILQYSSLLEFYDNWI